MPQVCFIVKKYISQNLDALKLRRIFQLVVVLELLHLKMEVTVSEPCDVIRVVQDMFQSRNMHAKIPTYLSLFN